MSKCHKRKFLNEELFSKGEKYPLKILPARSQMVGKQELHHQRSPSWVHFLSFAYVGFYKGSILPPATTSNSPILSPKKLALPADWLCRPPPGINGYSLIDL